MDLYLWSAKFNPKDFHKAVEYFDKAIECHISNAITWRERGIAKYAVGQYTEAMGDLDQAIQLDPDNPKSWAARGESKLALKK